MKQINLRIHYSFLYQSDTYLLVPDEIAALLRQLDRQEHANHERRRVHKAIYSLDINDGLEIVCSLAVQSPEEIFEQNMDRKDLYEAILLLPEKQMKRIYAHYFLGLGCSAIAKIEGVNKSVVSRSINQALKNLKRYLKNLEPEGQQKSKKSAE